MSETASQLIEMTNLDLANPHPSRKAWQAPKVIKSETESLASAQLNIFFSEDGDPITNNPPS